MFIIGNLLIGLATVLDSVLFIFTIIIIASAVISWVNADPHNQIVRIIHQLTSPIFRMVRRKIRTNFANMDFAPIIVLLIILFVQSGIVPSIFALGSRLTVG